jgi:hypothetical protein
MLKFSPAMQAIVTLSVLAFSIYVIVSGKYEATTTQWASGMVGTIFGVWLDKGRT